MRSRCKAPSRNKAEAYRVYGEHLFRRSDAADALRCAKASDIINYRDNTHVITDYRYDSFGRRIHTAERTKSGMRTIYDGLSFEVVKEAETFLGTRGITSSATGEANLNNYTPQVPQNGGPNNTAPSYGSDHTKGTRYYYIPNNAQGSQTRNNGETTQSAPSYGSDHTKGTRYYYIPNNAQGTQTAQDERNTQSSPSYGSEHTRGTRYYHIPDNPQSSQAQHSAIPVDRTKGVRTYLYLNGERVAINNLYNTNHGQYYYGSDILGSVKFITGQGGQELKRIEYDVFGGIYKGNSPYGLETGYTGKPYDAVTGLSDYGFRDYSPTHARFITEDPIRDGENWFAYVGNNPVNWIDPWGLSASDGKNKGTPWNMHSSVDFMKYTMGYEVFEQVKNARVSFTNTKRASSMPWGKISLPKNDTFQGGYNPNKTPSEIGRIGLETHELWHQYQYKTDFFAFGKLAAEQIKYTLAENDPYAKGDPVGNTQLFSNVKTIKDIPTLEGQAQFIGQWNADVYQYLTKGDVNMERLHNEAVVIIRSGFHSQAASDILLFNGGKL